jgi:hypothetical protein
LGITEHPVSDQECWAVAINYSPEPLEETLALAEGWQVEEVVYGETTGNTVHLKPNDAAILRLNLKI